MVEYLALPAWDNPPKTVDDWVEALSEAAGPVILSRESSTVSWLEVAPMRLRGYVVVENGHAAAINFEIHAEDPELAARALHESATALGYELHAEDGQDDTDADDPEDD